MRGEQKNCIVFSANLKRYIRLIEGWYCAPVSWKISERIVDGIISSIGLKEPRETAQAEYVAESRDSLDEEDIVPYELERFAVSLPVIPAIGQQIANLDAERAYMNFYESLRTTHWTPIGVSRMTVTDETETSIKLKGKIRISTETGWGTTVKRIEPFDAELKKFGPYYVFVTPAKVPSADEVASGMASVPDGLDLFAASLPSALAVGEDISNPDMERAYMRFYENLSTTHWTPTGITEMVVTKVTEGSIRFEGSIRLTIETGWGTTVNRIRHFDAKLRKFGARYAFVESHE
jgi:hypothetical protein